jgi:hypothetical protein
MGQSTFSVPSDMNFFTCDSENSSSAASLTRPSSSLGRSIQDVVTSHIEGSRIGKLVVEEMKNANNGRSKKMLLRTLESNRLIDLKLLQVTALEAVRILPTTQAPYQPFSCITTVRARPTWAATTLITKMAAMAAMEF